MNHYYLIPGKKLYASTIAKAISRTIEEMKGKDYLRKEYSLLKDESNETIHYWAITFKELNDALLANRSVFAVMEKGPRRLDQGHHHYSVYYTTEAGLVKNFTVGDFTLYLGAKVNKWESGLPYYTFYSGAIGMSRVLDATDTIFKFLQRIGGSYAQIKVI